MPQTHRNLQSLPWVRLRELAKGSFGACANAERVYREQLLPHALVQRPPTEPASPAFCTMRVLSERAQHNHSQLVCVCLSFLHSLVIPDRFPGPSHTGLGNCIIVGFIYVRQIEITKFLKSIFWEWTDSSVTNSICYCFRGCQSGPSTHVNWLTTILTAALGDPVPSTGCVSTCIQNTHP